MDGKGGAVRGDNAFGRERTKHSVSAILRGQDADRDIRTGRHIPSAGFPPRKERA